MEQTLLLRWLSMQTPGSLGERGLNWPAMKRVYERLAIPTREFDRCRSLALRIYFDKLGGERWAAIYLFMSAWPQVPLSGHYEALAAAHGITFSGIEHVLKDLVSREILPASSLNRTTFYSAPAERLLLGDLVAHLGLISSREVPRCLQLQQSVRELLGTHVNLGGILLSTTNLSVPDLYQAVGIQHGIPFEGLDASAPEIYRLASSTWPRAASN